MARPNPSHAADTMRAPESATAPVARRLILLTASARPEQWTKNLIVFAGLLFGGRLLEGRAVLLATATFAIFCALSACIYLFNDVMDRDTDRRHPLKLMRPIASGRLSSRAALATAGLLGAGALFAAVTIRPALGGTASMYLGLLLLYSISLKHIVIVDVLTIAGGFVLRAVAGALAVAVPISQWLLVCTILLALFLALSKRRHELTLLAEDAMGHRPILNEYSPYLLDQMIAVVTASTLIGYCVYSTSAETAERLGTNRLALTIPFVLYGIFRYLYLVHQKRAGGSPAELLLTDRPLLACVALWALSVVLVLYSPLGQ